MTPSLCAYFVGWDYMRLIWVCSYGVHAMLNEGDWSDCWGADGDSGLDSCGSEWTL